MYCSYIIVYMNIIYIYIYNYMILTNFHSNCTTHYNDRFIQSILSLLIYNIDLNYNLNCI